MNVRPDAEMPPVLDVLAKFEELAKQNPHFKGGAYSPTREDLNQIISISSWTSKEVGDWTALSLKLAEQNLYLQRHTKNSIRMARLLFMANNWDLSS
jgi:hypothetical protein